MPNEVEYILEYDSNLARVRVCYATDKAAVMLFMVQLETLHNGEWKPVRRYDDYHGRPHLDILDRWGHEYRKVWLDVDRNTALTAAIQDFKLNWEDYVAEWLEGEIHE